MTLQGLNRDGAVFSCIGVGEASPGGKISCFGSRKPCGLHWESFTGMQIVDKGAHAWKFVCVHGYRSGGTCRGHVGVSLRMEGKSPQSGDTWFTPTAEEDVVFPQVNGDCLLFKQDTASMVT